MKVVIFGATGATGKHLVQQALDRGHEVVAFVRDPGRMNISHDALRCEIGDVLRKETLSPAVAQCDAVLSALGTFPDTKADVARRQADEPVCSVGTTHILEVMRAHGVRRILVETAACIGSSRATGRFGAGAIVHAVMRKVMQDKERQEEILRRSGSEWTILRPAKLKEGPSKGRLEADEHLPWSLLSSATRADVATFMLDALEDPRSIQRIYTIRH